MMSLVLYYPNGVYVYPLDMVCIYANVDIFLAHLSEQNTMIT